LYLCTGNTKSSIVLASTGVDTTLWRHRLEHMSEKGMQILHKRNFLPDLKQIDLDFCEHCVYGKQKRVRFLRVRKEKKNKWKTSLQNHFHGKHLSIFARDS
jgi:hypothetical protein